MRPPILLLDGGLGTTLEAPPFNVEFTTETPLWSSHLLLSDPTTLHTAQRAFFEAGADIILTATYQSSVEGFLRTNRRYTREDAVRFMRSAIPLARSAASPGNTERGQKQARRRPGRIALSLGPFGATMSPVAAEYTGLYPVEMDDERALREWHAQRLRVFVDDPSETASWESVDYVAFETLRRADEVRAIRGAMRDVMQDRGLGQHMGQGGLCWGRNNKPWWVCGVFPAEEVDEDDVRRWVDSAVGGQSGLPRPWGIGINCTRIEHIAKIVSIMQDELRILSEMEVDGFRDEWASSTAKPWLVLYPDGTNGEKYDPVTKTWVTNCTRATQEPWDETYWDVVRRLSDKDWEGVIIGGCCRAGPAEITALRRRIDAEEQSKRV